MAALFLFIFLPPWAGQNVRTHC